MGHTQTSPPPSTTPSPAQAERFTTAQKIAMAVLLTANFTLAVDFSILNVALPHIGNELGFATSALQWIVTSFALCAAGFTLFFGRVADLFGRKRLFIIGTALLGVASLAGGLATEPVLLLVARVGQGTATAMITPAALSLMTTMFPEGPARSKALGLNGALMAAGFTAGAVLGGLLTGAVSWRWAFFINVVVAIAVIVIAPFVLREPARGARPKLDVPGAITITLALVALVLGIDTAGHNGWTHPGAWGPILAALILFAAFLKIESRVTEPLVAPSLLKRRNIGWGNTAGLLAFGTFTSLVFLLTLYLQEVLDLGAISTGVVLGVLGIGTAIGGLIAPKIIGRTSAQDRRRRRPHRPGRRDRTARLRRRQPCVAGAGADPHLRGRDREPRRDRRLRRGLHLRRARGPAGPRHGPGHDEPTGRDHPRDPRHVGHRHRHGRSHSAARTAARDRRQRRHRDRRRDPAQCVPPPAQGIGLPRRAGYRSAARRRIGPRTPTGSAVGVRTSHIWGE